MRFLQKLLGKNAPVPAWARFLTPDAFNRFIDIIRAELTARGLVHKLDTQAGTVTLEGNGDSHTLGLLNLAQRCGQIEPADWAGVVREHFEVLLVGTPRNAKFIDTLAADFREAQSYLRVRLQPSDYVIASGVIVSEPVADDLINVLVYDLPDSVASVHPEHVANWGVPVHDLFQLGLRNVRAAGLLPHTRIDLGAGGWLDHFDDSSNYFGSAHALLLHEYYNPQPELGLLVSVPHRHGMVVHSIEDLSSLRTSLAAIMYFTPRLYKQGPGSITESLYWSRYGTFTLLPYEVAADESVSFSPPDVFCEQVLNQISGESG